MSLLSFSAIILAAGRGTRMNSPLPKVVHPVAGQPMIYRLVKETFSAGAQEIRVVVGFGADHVQKIVEPLGAGCFRQENQRGTGDAARSAAPQTMAGTLIILNGDHPLVTSQDIEKLIKGFDANESDLTVVTCELEEPGAFGRIVRHKGEIYGIVEAKDASHETLKIREVNTGIYITRAEVLEEYLPQLTSNNAQGEFYLTDLVGLLIGKGKKVSAIQAEPHLAFGVNTQRELADANKKVFLRKASELLEDGVVILDPTNTYIEDEVTIEPGTVVYPLVTIQGRSRIGAFCQIETGSVIKHSSLADGILVKAHSYIEKSSIGASSEIGPFAHLRPDSKVGESCKVGNFVELKKTELGDRSKAGHLAYLGDAIIGKDVNIGCGTITANYAVDRKKYVTRIGDGVFVGSDSQFVAPVEIGEGAVIACGSTITKNVPAKALAVARARQIVKENFSPLAKSEKLQEKD